MKPLTPKQQKDFYDAHFNAPNKKPNSRSVENWKEHIKRVYEFDTLPEPTD